jgi:hypothetical protein
MPTAARFADRIAVEDPRLRQPGAARSPEHRAACVLA